MLIDDEIEVKTEILRDWTKRLEKLAVANPEEYFRTARHKLASDCCALNAEISNLKRRIGLHGLGKKYKSLVEELEILLRHIDEYDLIYSHGGTGGEFAHCVDRVKRELD